MKPETNQQPGVNSQQQAPQTNPVPGSQGQQTVSSSTQPTGVSTNKSGWVPSGVASYSQIPFYRKLWFIILGYIIFSPAVLFALWTGDVYKLDKNSSTVLVADASLRKTMYVVFVGLVIMSSLTVVSR